MLELSDSEDKTTMINMLRDLRKQIDNMEEQVGNVGREMEILRKNQIEMLEIKNTVIEMKKALIGSLDWAWLKKDP